MKVLFVEDEPALIRSAVPFLKSNGFSVDVVSTIEDAASAFATYTYDAILLDRHLPDGDGLSFLSGLRGERRMLPVIMMSAELASVAHRVEGLLEGADDYLGKPMDLDELLARLRAVLRRPPDLEKAEVIVGNLSFNLASRQALVDGRPLPMARRELGLLERLVRSVNRVVTRALIEEDLYGFDDDVTVNAIDVAMHRLRANLKAADATAVIHTVRGIGYILTSGERHG